MFPLYWLYFFGIHICYTSYKDNKILTFHHENRPKLENRLAVCVYAEDFSIIQPLGYSIFDLEPSPVYQLPIHSPSIPVALGNFQSKFVMNSLEVCIYLMLISNRRMMHVIAQKIITVRSTV